MVIAGEYAVLEGHAALSAAVDVRATCSVMNAARLQVTALGQGPLLAEETQAGFRFAGDEAGTFGLVAEVLTAAKQNGVSLPQNHFILDSDDFHLEHEGTRTKIGIGSSAAVAVALSAALLGDVRRSALSRLFQIALQGHLRFSRGRGSGIDVATSVFGGIVRFERDAASALPWVDPWPSWPPGVVPVVTFAGQSVSTRRFIEKLSHFAATHREGYLQAIHGVARATEELLEAFAPDADPAVFLAGVRRCGSAMRQLGMKADIDIFSAPHREIAKIAVQHDGAAKPSGAGGGDIAVAFVPESKRAALVQSLRGAGFPVLPLHLGDAGVREDDQVGAPQG